MVQFDTLLVCFAGHFKCTIIHGYVKINWIFPLGLFHTALVRGIMTEKQTSIFSCVTLAV